MILCNNCAYCKIIMESPIKTPGGTTQLIVTCYKHYTFEIWFDASKSDLPCWNKKTLKNEKY